MIDFFVFFDGTPISNLNLKDNLRKDFGLNLSIDLSQIGRTLIYELPIRISDSTIIGDVRIGAFSYLGPGCEIRNASIGRFCSIAANVAVGPAEHPIDWVSSHPFQFAGLNYFNDFLVWDDFKSQKSRFLGNSKKTVIGNDVWIGRNAIIRQGVVVGDGAIIGAGAFVNKDVEPYSIVVGVPAKKIRSRFDASLVNELLEIKWWNYCLNSEKNDIDFSNPVDALEKLKFLVKSGRLNTFKPFVYKISKKSEKYFDIFKMKVS